MRDKLSMIRKTIRTAWELDRTLILLILASAALGAVKPYLPILLSAYILDGFVSKLPVQDMIAATAACFSGVFILSAAQGYMDKIRDVHIETCVMDFEMMHARRTLEMDYQLLECPDVNSLRVRMKNDRSWGAGFYSVFWQLPYLLDRVLNLIVSFIILFPLFLSGDFFHSMYTLIFFGGSIVLSFVSAYFMGRFNAASNALIDELNSEEVQHNYGHFNYFYWQGGMGYKRGKDARVYNMQRLIRGYCEADMVWQKGWEMRASKNGAATGFASSFASGIMWAGAFLFVTLRAVAGAITVGAILKYANALNRFANGLAELSSAFNQFAVTAKRQQSYIEYMRFADVLHKGTLPVEKRRDNAYEIEFHDVSFTYPGSEQYALRHFSLKLNIGQKLAIVGMNGSGKTTMIKLLCRLYDPSEGAITLNGIDIRKYDYAEYMRIFSVVFQDFKLFSFKLSENIACSTAVDEERVAGAINVVGLSHRVNTLAHGLDTFLYGDFDEGIEISGGEAQKVALARALYKNAPFIVLDEPTAALDPIAEYEIYTKFNEIVGDKTAIYISHRLSSCRFCDDIAVFHEGRLIQRGSHEELVADAEGKYHALWNAQAQHYTQAL